MQALKSFSALLIVYNLLEFTTTLICNIGCQTCSGTSSNCSTCITNYYFSPDHGYCYQICPLGYQVDSTNMKCSKYAFCHSSCGTCSMVNDTTKCTSCPTTNMNFTTSPSFNSPDACTPQSLWQQKFVIDYSLVIGTTLYLFLYNATTNSTTNARIYDYFYRGGVIQFTWYTVNFIEFYLKGIGFNHSKIMIRTVAYTQCTIENKTIQLVLDSNRATYVLSTNQSTPIEFGPYVHLDTYATLRINFGTVTQKCRKMVQDFTVYVKSCESQCGTCSKEGTYVVSPGSNTCVLACQSNYPLLINKQCYACDSTCSTCIDRVDKCLTCSYVNSVKLYLYKNTCLSACPDGTYSSQSVCYDCLPGCATCIVASLNYCSSCNNVTISGVTTIYYKLINYTICAVNCNSKPGQYIDISIPNICQACSLFCQNCANSSTNCTSCNNGSFLLSSLSNLIDNSCISTCPSGYWSDTVNKKCVLCDPGCLTCTNSSTLNCLSCTNVTVNGTVTIYYKFMTTTRCATICNTVGQYSDSNIPNFCQPCLSPCKGCNTRADMCTSCITGYYYLSTNYTCFVTCPVGYFSNTTTQKCSACSLGCSTCSSASSTNCLTCNNVTSSGIVYIYYKSITANTCKTTCATAGQFIDLNFPNYCQSCSTECATCTNSATHCLTCASTYYFFSVNSSCLSSCPSGYYPNTTAPMNCIACTAGCMTCTSIGLTNCQSCKNQTISGTNTIYYKVINSTKCDIVCNLNGQYLDLNFPNVCQACQAQCKTCLTSSNFCLTCNPNFYFYSDNNSCLATCPDQYYANTTFENCMACSQQCLTCTSAGLTNCLSCKNTTDSGTQIIYYKVINATICALDCSVDGQFLDNLIPNVCQSCSSQCKTCTISSVHCITCNNNFFFYQINSSCLSTCPDGYYADVGYQSCIQCASGCQLCTNGTLDDCQQCSSVNTGSSIVSYFKKMNSDGCVTSCQTGQYQKTFDHICTLCDPTCTQCLNSSLNCTSCSSSFSGVPYFLYSPNSQNQCVSQCPPNSYSDVSSSSCQLCHHACERCSGAGVNSCSSCHKSQADHLDYFFISTASSCVIQCPDGFFNQIQSHKCQSCFIGCKKCSETANNCSQCDNSGTTRFYFTESDNTCTQNCPQGLNKNTTTMKCECSYFTFNGTCLTNCSNDTYVENSSGKIICKNCSTVRGTCSEPIKLKLWSKIVNQGKQIEHSIHLSSGLNPQTTEEKLKSSIKIFVFRNKETRLLEVQENIYLLQDEKFQVVVTKVTISPSREYIFVYTQNFASQVQLTKASIEASFVGNVLTNSQGQGYMTITNQFDLIEPVFMKSYYEIYQISFLWVVQGIIACTLTIILVLVTIYLKNNKVFNEGLALIMTISSFGLLRMKSYPLVLKSYFLLLGFASFEFTFLPNWFMNILPTNEQQISLKSVQFSLQSFNFIRSNGTSIFVFLILELIVLVYCIIYQKSRIIPERLKMMQHFVICMLLPKSIFSTALVFYQFYQNINNLLQLKFDFWLSFGIALSIIIASGFYLFVWIIKQRKYQMYKILNMLRPIVIFVIILYPFEGMIALNSLELIVFSIDVYLYRKSKINKYLYFLQFVLVSASFNYILFLDDSFILTMCLGLTFTVLFAVIVTLIFKSQNLNSVVHSEFQKDDKMQYSNKKSAKYKIPNEKAHYPKKYQSKGLNQSEIYRIDVDYQQRSIDILQNSIAKISQNLTSQTKILQGMRKMVPIYEQHQNNNFQNYVQPAISRDNLRKEYKNYYNMKQNPSMIHKQTNRRNKRQRIGNPSNLNFLKKSRSHSDESLVKDVSQV